ncbi:unnamed protein product [Parnassius mnemosyne]|uniref:PHD-type domain-containing protein n=1 Tax=Parnassius mnemosyne TaxID=213953 RepID=A0AAV1L542_9NEOP
MDKKIAQKMVKYPVCCKCQKKIIKKRDILCCVSCKNFYDITCAQVLSTKVNTMDKLKKEIWKCQTCHEVKAKLPIASENTDTLCSYNLTKRSTRHKAPPVTPLHKSEEEESTSSDDDLHSLPDISSYQNDREEELLKEIANLKLELEKAHNEIENLNMENTKLQKQILEKETLTVKWKKLFTEAMSTPKRRASLTNRNTEKKKDNESGQSPPKDLD